MGPGGKCLGPTKNFPLPPSLPNNTLFFIFSLIFSSNFSILPKIRPSKHSIRVKSADRDRTTRTFYGIRCMILPFVRLSCIHISLLSLLCWQCFSFLFLLNVGNAIKSFVNRTCHIFASLFQSEYTFMVKFTQNFTNTHFFSCFYIKSNVFGAFRQL